MFALGKCSISANLATLDAQAFRLAKQQAIFVQTGFCWHNGSLWQPSQAEPLHLGIRYGLALFETCRWTNASLQFAHYHAARLARGLENLFALPPENAQQQSLRIFHQVSEVLAQHSACHARIRLDVWATGDSSPYGIESPWETDFSFNWIPLTADPFCHQPPVTIGVLEGYHPATGHLTGLKTTSAAPYAAAARAAAQQGWHDALLLTTNGHPAETTRYNLIAFLDGTWRTPSASHGLVQGVIRQVLLDRGLLSEAPLTIHQLRQANAICLTNATYGIVPVQNLVIGHQSFPPAPTTHHLPLIAALKA